VERLALYLVKPSRYDDDGYPVRHLRGAVPSNTLSTLCGLTRDAERRGMLGGVRVDTRLVDEAVQRVPWGRIRRDARRRGTRVLVALCGVQTNQFPRAQDLARRCRALGLEVIVGGFHVSGANALVAGVAPELQEMLDLGVHLFRGEADECWGGLLRQAVDGTLPLMIDRLGDRPDLYDKPIPVTDVGYFRRFALPGMGTLDAGRGCPFDCSFCTIVNVQGRRMRYRSPANILEAMRHQYAQGTRFYFFTDDNFARHPEWEAVFDGMAALRREGLEITFMMQVDTLATRIPRFVDKAKAAGCVQVFIGLESINPVNLLAGGKRQNLVSGFREMIEDWHTRGIITNCGYILGFPEDTPASIAEDVRRLRDEIGTDLASFFILTTLPGSRDHARAVGAGVPLDADLNRYDSLHVMRDHPRMSREALLQAYRGAWTEFFSVPHMKRSLARLEGAAYWSLFKSYFWHRNASELGEHPMMSGFHRLRDRAERRPTFPREGWLAHARRQARETAHQVRVWGRLLLEMQEVWLATRRRSVEEGRLRTILKAAITVRPAVLLANAAAWFHRRRVTREDLDLFWAAFNRMRWIRANPLRAPVNAVCESALMLHFVLQVLYVGGVSRHADPGAFLA
jgi:radical SAM superfamily enzyme YgiQ (UPF0313 family)